MKHPITSIFLAAIAFCLLVPAAGAQATIKTLFTWTGGGGNPLGNLVFDSAGNLYGTTADTEGTTVFQLSPNSDGTWTQHVLWASNGGTDPIQIQPGVVFDASGNIYLTSFFGGNSNCGTVFKVTHNSDGTWTESKLLDFDCAAGGAEPSAGVTFDKAGNLYGMATEGGSFGHGLVFQLSPNADGSWTEHAVHNFTGGSDGAYPDHGFLVFDSSGAMYGSAAVGAHAGNCSIFGFVGCGTIFKLTPHTGGTWTFTVLHTFTGGTDGGNPESTLLFDKSGNLYGTTYGGGQFGFGVAYELIPHANGKWGEKVLHTFKGGGDGTNPIGGLIFDTAGNLYGTTFYGGNTQCNIAGNPIGCGIVYELTANASGTWTQKVLTRFHGTPNSTPGNDLVMDSHGNFFGPAAGFDTASDGSIYELTP
jgi:uncharacterized repeat protein (TIGR03803 family)